MNSSITLTSLAAVFTQPVSATNLDDQSNSLDVARVSEVAPNQQGLEFVGCLKNITIFSYFSFQTNF